MACVRARPRACVRACVLQDLHDYPADEHDESDQEGGELEGSHTTVKSHGPVINTTRHGRFQTCSLLSLSAPTLPLPYLPAHPPPPPAPEPPTPSRQYSNRPSCSPFPSHRCIRCPVRVHIRPRLHLRAPSGVIARSWLGVLLHVHPRAHATATSAARVGPAMRSSAGNLSPDTGQTGQSAGSADPGSPARVGAG